VKPRRRIHVTTLGCPKNQVDTEVMLGVLARAGHEIVLDPEAADVLVVNTCAFIGPAKEESIDAILEAARTKAAREGRRLVVTGCLAQRYADALVGELPEVDALVGTGDLTRIAEAVAAPPSDAPIVYRGAQHELPAHGVSPRVRSGAWWTAYLKVSEGCDHRCSFCIIPKIRGRHESRAIADVVDEAMHLAADGALELNLIAQDLTAYGHDLPGRPQLHQLLEALCSVDVRWIRLHYAYPRVFPDALIEVMAREPRIAKYLDMPLQHASDRLLRSMRRGRDSAFLIALLAKLRARIPGLTFRTSLIAGLPGETEDDFALLKEFVRTQRFERMGCFQYSDEEGTAAYDFADKVPQKVIERRWREVMAVQKRINREQNRALIGKRLEVLVEGPSPESEHLLVGRHEGQAPDIDGVVYINDGFGYPGEFVTVEVTEAHDYDLVGRVVNRPERRPVASA